MIVLSVIIAAVTGLAIGSFLNVVIHRVPRGQSIAKPRSACPHCGASIRSSDNIPVLSWLLLRGRCRDCQEPISPLYPAVEIVTALAFTALAWQSLTTAPWGSAQESVASSLQLLAFLWLGAAGIVLIVIDAQSGRLPNAIVAPLYIAGLSLLTVSAIVSSDYAWQCRHRPRRRSHERTGMLSEERMEAPQWGHALRGFAMD